MLEIFETHAHYHAEQFNEDRNAILIAMHEGFLKPTKESAAGADVSDHRAAGNEADCAARTDGTGCTAGQDETAQPPDCEKTYRIQKIVDIAAEKDSLDPVMELTRRYDFVYGAIGLHPDEIGDLDDETERYMESCLTDPKIVAVGEIGIDYYWNKEARDVQIAGFERQIDMAVRHGLPVIVHSREAAEDTMNVVRANANSLQAAGACPGIIHCYSYSVEHARMYADMGFMLGIGGVVTYKNAKKLKEVVREIPLSRLVLETDCPYLAPTPFRGKRNDSRLLVYVAEAIAELKGISVEEVVRATAENAERLFFTQLGKR